MGARAPSASLVEVRRLSLSRFVGRLGCDVEKLLRVKDLLKNQGFTIAGARKRLSEPAPEPTPEPAEPDSGAKNMRRVLLGLRQDLMRLIEQFSEPRKVDRSR
jgi:hypothetical protein